MFHARYVVFALMLGASATFGCSDSDSDDGKKDGTAQVSEDTVTVSISAKNGGEVKLGDAALKIPAGALSKDTDVTLEAKTPAKSLPDQDSLQGMTYDFGPDGTTFEKPVELTLPLDAEPGDDQVAVISWYDEESKTWKDLTATVKDGVVVAEVEHFTLFVVRFKGVESGAFDCGFEPCGADGLEGTWSMAGACIDTGEAQDNPFQEIPECKDSTFDVGVDAEGEVTFTADTFDYNWKFVGQVTLTLSEECTATVSPTGCENFKFNEGVVCTTIGARCQCTGPAGDPEEQSGTGTYTVDGDEITFVNDDEDDTDPPTAQKICVKGDQAKLQQTSTETDDDSGETVTQVTTLVLTRK